MNKQVCALAVFLLCSIGVWGQKIDSITALYKSIGIELQVPQGFVVKEPSGDWADMRIERDSLELMYKAMNIPYQQMAQDPSKESSFYWAMSLATVKNLSNEDLPKLVPIPKDENSKDFNADLGFVYLFTPRRTFSEYKHAFILGLHKSGHQDVAVVLLGNDLQILENSIRLLIVGNVRYR